MPRSLIVVLTLGAWALALTPPAASHHSDCGHDHGAPTASAMVPRTAPRMVHAAVPPAGPSVAPKRGEGIHWEDSLAAARTRAKAERRIIFIAVNMDGEAGNDRMAKNVYPNKTIQALAAETVNLAASIHRHEKSGDCPRFGGVPCSTHQSVEIRVREEIFGGDETTPVIAPHHVFLGPDGEVLMSVPYEVSASELEWCFHASFDAVEAAGGQPVVRPKRSKGGRRPRRLIAGGVIQLDPSSIAPLTREEALEFIREANKGSKPKDFQMTLQRLVAADQPEALDFTETWLRKSKGSTAATASSMELLRTIGAQSPVSYWSVVAEFATSGPIELQNEAIVALEQLGAPGSLTVLHKALRKAKEPGHRKNVIRALGACGRDDKKTRTALLKASSDKRSALFRSNALVALGWLDAHPAVDERLRQGLLPNEFGAGSKLKAEDITDQERVAAAVAMGLTRNEVWLPTLERAEASDDLPGTVARAITAARETIKTSRFSHLSASLKLAGADEIPRDRFFRQ